MDFIKELKLKNNQIKIIPRFRCEGFTAESLTNWFKEDNINQFIKLLMRRLKFYFICYLDITSLTD